MQFEVLKQNISMVAQNTKKLSEEQFNIVPIHVEAQATHPTLAIPEVPIPFPPTHSTVLHAPNLVTGNQTYVEQQNTRTNETL